MTYCHICRAVPLLKPRAQTTPEPTLLSWGGWPHEKNPPSLATLPNPILLCLSGHSDPIVFKPSDVALWFSGVPWKPYLLKICLGIESDCRNGFFIALYTDLKVELNFYDHYLQRCMKMHLMLPLGPALHGGAYWWGEIVQWGLKAWSR